MNVRSPRLTMHALVLVAALTPPLSHACSEGMFGSGKGLAYQTYLAPRPARLLIYSPAPVAEREALHAGLQKAGHQVTVVDDASALAAAIKSEQYDVVITGLDDAQEVASQGGENAPPVLPIVARADRNSPVVRDRFDLVLLDSASLGQYLRTINRALRSQAN